MLFVIVTLVLPYHINDFFLGFFFLGVSIISCTYKKVKDQHNLVDRISELPDGIVISIVSLLTLKEAVASSILSRRWRYVWASSIYDS